MRTSGHILENRFGLLDLFSLIHLLLGLPILLLRLQLRCFLLILFDLVRQVIVVVMELVRKHIIFDIVDVDSFCLQIGLSLLGSR